MRSSSSWLVRTSLLLGAALVHLVPVSVADTVTVRTGSLHISDGYNFRGWFDKGSNLGNHFLVIYSDPSGNKPHWENQGSFFYKDAGPGNAVKIYCKGCGIHQGTGEVVDLQLGTVIGQYSGYTVWFPYAVSERSQNLEHELRRRDLSVSFLWQVDSSSGPDNDWPVTPILHDASGAQTTQGMIINTNSACSVGQSPTTNCDVWWGPGTNPPATVTQISVMLTFRQTGLDSYWAPPDDASAAMCL